MKKLSVLGREHLYHNPVHVLMISASLSALFMTYSTEQKLSFSHGRQVMPRAGVQWPEKTVICSSYFITICCRRMA
jgi:hypothetical protein